MVEAYSMINQKLQTSTSEQENLEKTIQELKVKYVYQILIQIVILYIIVIILVVIIIFFIVVHVVAL